MLKISLSGEEKADLNVYSVVLLNKLVARKNTSSKMLALAYRKRDTGSLAWVIISSRFIVEAKTCKKG